MHFLKKTKKRGVRKHRNFTNKNKAGVIKRYQRNRNKIFRTKSVNNILNPYKKTVWVIFNENIINDGFNEKVNKFKEKIGNVDGKIVYGKFWMTGCGYCDAVKGTWDLVVGSLKNHSNYVNVDILSDNIEEGKIGLKVKTNLRENIKSDGYPCFYKIVKGNIYYYEGERSVNSMKIWLLSNKNSI